MAQRKGTVEKFQPTRGLNTEASETNFPEDAAYDLDNTEITKEGKSRRRLGAELESGGSLLFEGEFTATHRASGLFSTFLWKLVDADQTADLRIIQYGSIIKVVSDTTPLSAAIEYLSINLTTAPFTIGRPIASVCQYASGAGFLIITNENCNSIYIRNAATEIGIVTLEANIIDHKIRTRELLTPFTEGPNYGANLSDEEEFNLRNSGWLFEATVADNQKGSSVSTEDPVAYYRTKRGAYPTHSLLFNAMKLGTAAEVVGVNSFSPWADLKINFGNTRPPLGHYIHSAYSFNSRELMLAEGTPISGGETTWSIQNRPICCGFLNGHAIYGDIDQNNKARLLVSQVAKNFEDLARCYQDADPTADEINDLIATDGFISRPVGMGKPIAMRETSKGLVIMCTNGVWVMRGTAGPFSATDFTVDKLSDLKFNSPNSVVVVDDVVFFCAEKAIYAIIKNDFGELQLQNLTASTIKTEYLSYGVDAINNISGTYVQEQNYVYWLIPNTPDPLGNKADAYKILVLNLELQGFFIYSFEQGDNLPALLLPMALTNSQVTTVNEPVTINDGTEQVFAGGELVTTQATVVSREQEQLYIMCGLGSDAFMATLTSRLFADWSNVEGATLSYFKSFIEFAYVTPPSYSGGVAAPYIHSYFEKGRGVAYEFTPVENPNEEYWRMNQVYAQVLEDKSNG